MDDVVADVRVAAIASLTPLEELDGDPFLVDPLCARWAADRGYVVTRQLRVHGLRPDHRAPWQGSGDGQVEVFVAANDRVLARAPASAGGFAAECEDQGVRLEFADLEEPVYTARTKAGVHRGLSMPTAGYDGC
ncbi:MULTISPECIES: hypothetical protein [unclassified Streptomyces]|uniref:hypothetical protein n=1 Tax=unclassified Streptomyces TaxID=2593676 RepID=UPI000CD59BBE|nr:hypothetical protein [Streptomyces sp. SM10]